MNKQEFKKRREALGLTQYDLADILEIRANSVHYWEVGKRPIREFAIDKIKELEQVQAEAVQVYVQDSDGDPEVPFALAQLEEGEWRGFYTQVATLAAQQIRLGATA